MTACTSLVPRPICGFPQIGLGTRLCMYMLICSNTSMTIYTITLVFFSLQIQSPSHNYVSNLVFIWWLGKLNSVGTVHFVYMYNNNTHDAIYNFSQFPLAIIVIVCIQFGVVYRMHPVWSCLS